MARTYREAGVDIEKEDQSIASLVSNLVFKRQGLGAPIDLPGYFTGLLDFGDWALTLNMDGVGTKLLVAEALGIWDTIGIDCVAMNVNDALCVGAEPLAMVDYFAVSKYDEEVAGQVGIGLNRGAELANITLIGGEFATVPELVRGYDLVGTCLGYLPKDRIVDGRGISPGQLILGLPSSGLHSNGFTLVRSILQDQEVTYEEKVPGMSETWGDVLLTPTEIYVREVLELLKECQVTGMAHITGGGLANLSRMRGDVAYEVTDPLPPQEVFTTLQELGSVQDKEMYSTFNMGQGFVITLKEESVETALRVMKNKGRRAQVLGRVTEGRGVTLPGLDLRL